MISEESGKIAGVTLKRAEVDFDRQLYHEALEGLTRTPKELSPKWFYDQRGSALFEDITRLPEY